MDKLWANLHGGSTHFPIGLMIASVLFDFLAYVVKRDPYERDLHAAGFYTLLLGAAGSFLAVLSGFLISAWQFFGPGLLGLHHDFVWPAFVLMIGLAVWRLRTRNAASRRAFGVYLVIAAVTSGLMAAAGYYGGEMLGGGQPAQSVSVPPPQTAGPKTSAAQLVVSGRGLYLQNCVNCHGQNAQGQIGPTLHHLGDPDAKVARNIANGFPPRMPAYKNTLTASQIQALVAYVQSLK